MEMIEPAWVREQSVRRLKADLERDEEELKERIQAARDKERIRRHERQLSAPQVKKKNVRLFYTPSLHIILY